MDTQKFVLFLIFATSLLFLWDAWQKEQNPPTTPAQTAVTQGPGAKQPSTSAQSETPIPGEELASDQREKAGVADSGAPVTASGKLVSGEKVIVKTDMVVAEIDTAGGDIRRL